jgi:hypothetical protein
LIHFLAVDLRCWTDRIHATVIHSQAFAKRLIFGIFKKRFKITRLSVFPGAAAGIAEPASQRLVCFWGTRKFPRRRRRNGIFLTTVRPLPMVVRAAV